MKSDDGTENRMERQTETEKVIGELYDLYGKRLFGYLLVLLCRKEDAEDALQTVFMKVSRRPDLLDSVDNVRSYLFTAARNEAFSLLRKRTRRKQQEAELTEEQLVVSKEESAENREQTELLNKALKSLSPEQRECVVLHSFQGLTFKEVAEILGVSKNTVTSRYRLAVEKLKRSVKWRAGI